MNTAHESPMTARPAPSQSDFRRSAASYRDSEEVAPGVVLDHAEDGQVIGAQVGDAQDLPATGMREGPVKAPAA